MTEFNNITIEKVGNSYFDGSVTSRTIKFDDGSKKTLGFMLPGKYEFATQTEELMEITSGKLEVQLPNTTKWINVTSGESFNVPKNSTFQVDVKEITDYCCSYL